MFSDYLLVLSLLATASSQLRPMELPVGPGEIGLAIWLSIAAVRLVTKARLALTPALARLLTFWLVFAFAMSLGWVMGYVVDNDYDQSLVLHDVVAYLIAASFSCLMAVEFQTQDRLRRIVWLLSGVGALWLALQLAGALALPRVAGLDMWEWDRLRGLSDNSNQLALVCVVLAFLPLHLASTGKSAAEITGALACLVTAVVAGRFTKSDAFLLVVLVAVPVFLLLRMRLLALRLGFTPSRAGLLTTFALLPALLIASLPYADFIATEGPQLVKGMTRGGGKADTEESTNLRFEIWSKALNRGIEVGMLGLGPGPHLQIPPSILAGRDSPSEPDHVSHPKAGRAPNFEAHNTVLDMFLQGGVIVLLDIAWLIGSTLLATYRARLDALTTLICGVAVYSIFHLIIRHPILWFAIVVCLVMGFDAPPSDRKTIA